MDQPDARLDGRQRFPAGHGWADCHVSRAGADLAGDERGVRRQRGGHAQIRDDDRSADVARQHVDRRAALQEVLDHLRRHDLRIRAHSLGDDSMVGRQREDHAAPGLGRELARHLAEPPRQLLEAAEASRRLGQLVERPLGLEPGRAVRLHDSVKELREHVHGKAREVGHP